MHKSTAPRIHTTEPSKENRIVWVHDKFAPRSLRPRVSLIRYKVSRNNVGNVLGSIDERHASGLPGTCVGSEGHGFRGKQSCQRWALAIVSS